MSAHEPIRFLREGRLGVVVLDRQAALNALTRAMVRELSDHLRRWKDDPEVEAVLVKAVPGRAFCAGGDVRAVVDTVKREGVGAALPFFRDEYRMNWRIARFPKPYVALLNGITMGGGCGISIHGSHRIVTEHALLAMPETGIGFFPDIGASYFLNRCPAGVGLYLGLTGARLEAADALLCGLATHFVPAARLLELEARLVSAEKGEVAARLEEALRTLGEPPPASRLEPRLPAIRACFTAESFRELVARLESEPSGWGREQLALLREKSPLALRLVFAQLRRTAEASLEECLRLEYRMVRHALETGEFAEGVRALLVDKDRSPRWRHRDFEEVDEAEVEGFFAPIPEGDLPLDWEGI
ncbi:MAG: enoyl-CoA hydratase/isomerase family protein [Geminicoccaceae bacterium]|nr:enoyl-CoA hydratase/isomerase family protein [Geminicoccaceae bacterium]MCS7267125.1 enoyl-CoA hydratase/isomerase family protein [Geminicoccaceae bacterium]MDW8125710.1 enoyl-CoA hydratase/isomerase family protein [Geminicoccaceae bacterium]MDW8341703.1 enoyl-CoA hydratase/isomerase family protein [Geminicoccaceae bacterium]